MTPEWIRLTRPSGKPRHLHVSHLVSVSPSTGGSEIEMTGHEYNVRETDEEIMALLGVDARPVQPDKQPARTTIIIGRETLVSLANRQAVVVGNVTMIDGDNFPRGLFSSPATPSEEPQPTGAAPELGALQEAQMSAFAANRRSPGPILPGSTRRWPRSNGSRSRPRQRIGSSICGVIARRKVMPTQRTLHQLRVGR